MTHSEAAIDGAHIEANRVYADKGSGSQRQSTVSKKAKDQEIKSIIIHRAYKNKPLSSRQLLRYDKSQRPGGAEKYLHESEKGSQQNFCGQAVEGGSSPSKYWIRGGNSLKKRKNFTSCQRTHNQCHPGIFPSHYSKIFGVVRVF